MGETENRGLLLRSAIRTPDGTVLVSRTTHDYKTHTDTVSGEVYILDGGCSYLRTSINKVPAEDLSIYSTDSHEKIRENVDWGSYGKEGEEPLHYILLKDLTDEHLRSLTKYKGASKIMRVIFENEVAYRKTLETLNESMREVLSIDASPIEVVKDVGLCDSLSDDVKAVLTGDSQ